MNSTGENVDANFFQLVMSLQIAAMQYMGKIVSPMTGKVERNLEQAKVSVDMLSMIAEKTKGNLSEQEEKLINNILHELRLNYVDEANKPAEKGDEADDKKAAGETTETGDPETTGTGDDSGSPGDM